MNYSSMRLKLALAVQRSLAHRQPQAQQDRRQIWAGLQEQADLLLRRISRFQHADQRNLRVAAQVAESRAHEVMLQLGYAINHAVPRLNDRRRPSAVTLRDLYEDLGQLEAEFGGLSLDPKAKTISVITDSIGLEGVPLGPFGLNCMSND